MSEIQYKNFQELEVGREGLVFLGAGGSIQEWIDGITTALFEADIIQDKTPESNFSDFIVLETTGGRTDLVMVFKNGAKINIGMLAMWRIQIGDCSWISDYKVNYSDQHGFLDIEDEEREIDPDDESQCPDCCKDYDDCTCDIEDDNYDYSTQKNFD